MADIRTIESGKYNKMLAEALKKSGDFEKPVWVDLVKTSAHKMRPTIDADFWHNRSASILRQIYIRGTVGVERLRTRYGGRKDRGMQPPRFVKSGGKIIRTILQQAEAAGLLEKAKGKKAGRIMTKKGREFLESLK
ncbi:40S ribosomal protein S19 [Candidatus Pacearchaeota archaeon]|nr:40S ribosomal protein S19 [Candidatus Pacearchaeota archaeon]